LAGIWSQPRQQCILSPNLITDMTAPRIAGYGSWNSPITSDFVVAETIGVADLRVAGEAAYWIEARPTEGGRNVLVRYRPDGTIDDVTPPPWNVRTRVHEYGGASYVIAGDTVFFSNFADQLLYRLDPGGSPLPFSVRAAARYADGRFDVTRNRLILVCEDHGGPGAEPVNTIVSLPLDAPARETVLVSGADFYAAPRPSPDGMRLAWIAWNHPDMPWTGSTLHVATISGNGTLADARVVAGGTGISVMQPEWSADGVLHYVSDETGWWNLYRIDGAGPSAVLPMAAEFAAPLWNLGPSFYAFAGNGEIACAFNENGLWSLGIIAKGGALRRLATPFQDCAFVNVLAGGIVCRAGSPQAPAAIVRIDAASGAASVVKPAATLAPALAPYLARPQHITFASGGAASAHAFYYPPTNPDYTAPEGERPPLLVKSHGGPTSATTTTLDLRIQYWTSRGIGVLDVNYGGSSGYGRAYRDHLDGRWGIVDVEDCVSGALHLVTTGRADAERLMISGGSAGGYTTLAALAFHDVFRAGASYYGVADLEALARDTHKFESRYLDRLVGPYPQERQRYIERSPIHAVDRFSAPVIFFQGEEDKVVPPNQAEMMVAALKRKQLPFGYFIFAGEQHGFRKAATIKRALDAELYFYAATVLKTGLRF
jgi:dipeptidyl aminopeptidase/acylaminoacyl peptidase